MDQTGTGPGARSAAASTSAIRSAAGCMRGAWTAPARAGLLLAGHLVDGLFESLARQGEEALQLQVVQGVQLASDVISPARPIVEPCAAKREPTPILLVNTDGPLTWTR